jgi:hypothetical protein
VPKFAPLIVISFFAAPLGLIVNVNATVTPEVIVTVFVLPAVEVQVNVLVEAVHPEPGESA